VVEYSCRSLLLLCSLAVARGQSLLLAGVAFACSLRVPRAGCSCLWPGRFLPGCLLKRWRGLACWRRI